MYKILIADDHAVVRKGLIQILKKSPDLAVKAEASSGAEALEMVSREKWDAVVLDLSMPGMSGMDALKQMHTLFPRLPILVLSVHPEDQYGIRVLKAGASGYLTKDAAPEELVNALLKVCRGGKYVSPSLAERLALSFGMDGELPRHETLSDREYEVLRLLGSGLTISQAAEKMCLSVKTVSTYRSRILEKMQMGTTAEIIHYAIHEGIGNETEGGL